MIKLKLILIVSLLCFLKTSFAAANCPGKFVNPITDICWSCLFPITIGAVKVTSTELPDTENPSSPVCACGTPIPRIGLSLGFWEPVRLVDVIREPFCLVNLGGTKLSLGKQWSKGSVAPHTNHQNGSFYQVHWYVYPVLYWLNLLIDGLCLEKQDFDIAYLTELDPLWNDDELSFILNPEAVLFSSLPAQAACGADCLMSSTGLPKNTLFWCAGCQGSMYPLTGWVPSHVGAIQASTLLLQRMTYKLHREGLLLGTTGNNGLCSPYYMPIMHKNQYRYQMTYPFANKTHWAETFACQPYGRSTSVWGAGREYPYKGEDFGFLIWRKRNCCAA